MSLTVRNKLLAYQEPPPGQTWSMIYKKMQEEYAASDAHLSQRISQTAIAPPAPAWEMIAAAIDSPVEKMPSKPAKVIPIYYKRLAAAVIAAVLVGLSALYLFNTDQQNEQFSQRSAIPADKKNGTDSEAAQSESQLFRGTDSMPDSGEIIPGLDTASKSHTISDFPINDSRPVSTRTIKEFTRHKSEVDNVEQVNTIEALYADMPTTQLKENRAALSVSAPPLRDGNGNIIMDLSLISSPGSRHIVVTGPNGVQTRISKKFVHWLSYLNRTASSCDNDMVGLAWQTRFEEWRNQLLQEAAFIPSANNFLDILELKEMIRDR